MSIIWTIIIGFVAGLIARFFHPGNKYEPKGFILTTCSGLWERSLQHTSARRSGGITPAGRRQGVDRTSDALSSDGGDYRSRRPRRLCVKRNGNQTQTPTWTTNDKQKSRDDPRWLVIGSLGGNSSGRPIMFAIKAFLDR